MNELVATKRGTIVWAGTLAAFGLLLAGAPLALPAGDHLVGNGYGGAQTTPVVILGAVAQLGIVWLCSRLMWLTTAKVSMWRRQNVARVSPT
jgi:hypothetical protein